MRERVRLADRGHPIADGLPEYFEIPEAEMYGEPHDVPEPDRTVFVSWFEGDEVFRSGLCYRRESRPDLRVPARPRALSHLPQEEIRQVLRNAWSGPCRWKVVRRRMRKSSRSKCWKTHRVDRYDIRGRCEKQYTLTARVAARPRSVRSRRSSRRGRRSPGACPLPGEVCAPPRMPVPHR